MAIAYALLAKIALGFFSANGVVSVVWPSSGLALAALLIGGKKYWPGVFVGALVGNIIQGSSVGVSIFIALGNTLGALACVWLLARIRRFNSDLTQPRDFLWIGFTGALGSCVSALIGVATLLLAGILTKQTIAQNLLHWWLGDTLGIILVTPLILVWRHPPYGWFSRGRMVETVACFGLAFFAGQIIFLGWFHEVFGITARGFWVFLFVTWGAVRFGRHGALLIIGMTAIQMLLGMVLAVGGSTNNQVPVGLLNFWLYILAVTVVGILLALVIDERRSTEAALRQSRDLFNKLSQRVPGVIYQFRLFPDGRSCFPFASEAIQDIYEVTPEQVREDASAVFAILHPEDYDGIVASIQESARTLKFWRHEFRVVLPKQGVRWRLGESQPEKLEDGSVLWHGFISDITERKLADQERNWLTDILERSLNEIYLFDAETLLFAYVNEGARRNLGYATDVLRTMTPLDIKPEFDESSFRHMIAPLLHGEKEQLFFETVHRRADDTVYPVEVHLQLTGLQGRSQFLAVILDITERKRIEQELLLTQTAVEKSKSAFYRVSSTGIVLYANDYACQSLGYTREELFGMHVWEFDPDFPPEAWAPLWEGLRQTRVVNLETRHRRKDGTIFPVEVVGNVVSSDGEEYSFVFVQDITERKQSEERILRLSKLYKALSETNQAIVRMQQQAELFPLVCRCAVEFGGMRLAWIGQLDEASELIVPAASDGDWQGYLDGIRVSSHADVPEGRGPTGTALRENRAIIVNDYFNDPMTASWQVQATNFGWSSAASFPIQRGGRPFAVLSVYHAQVNAFDEEAIALLEEMSIDISFALDNFDREMQRKAAEESLRLAASVYDNSSEAMTVTDADGIILTVNPAFTKITGYLPEEVIGKNSNILGSDRQNKAFYRAMWHDITTTGRWQGEIWDRRKNGEIYAIWLTINTIFNEDGTVHRRVSLFSDASEWKETEALIWRQANFDVLTELPNRQMFYDRLDQDIKKAHRAGRPLALMFLDLDRFKEVNDTLGHDMGDALLKDAAQRLSSCVRETDTVARLGGDEFTVILGELDDPGSVERVAQDILHKLTEPFHLGDEIAYVSASIGVTLYPEDATEIDTLLKNADQAMYAAKNLGRNRYSYFTPSMQQAVQTRMQIANDLRGALAGHQFWIAYQPIVELATGAIHKAEALLRWQHPTQGLVSPAAFIPVAEDTGLIVGIGDWVFREAAQQAKRWRAVLHPAFQISVNKSPVQFHNESQGHLAWYAYLRQLGLPGQSITVEITEGLLLDASTRVADRLLEFRDAGIQVSIDDFGTGYSALSYLKKFDIDYLKIDQSFTRNLAPGSDDMALCEAIIVMAHKLDIKVIAEGVETEEQKNLLIAAGCDYAQGYLFSRPVPVEEFEKLESRKPGTNYQI